MNIKIIDISKDLIASEHYPGAPVPTLTSFSSIESGDVCNITRLNTIMHCGTHADAPLHFLKCGKTVNSLPKEYFVGECRVIEISEEKITERYVYEKFPTDTKRLLLKSGGSAYFDKNGAEAAAGLNYNLIGTDATSVGSEADQEGPHKAFLIKETAIVENLNLSLVKPGKYYIVAAPVKIAGAEASPVRALLFYSS